VCFNYHCLILLINIIFRIDYCKNYITFPDIYIITSLLLCQKFNVEKHSFQFTGVVHP